MASAAFLGEGWVAPERRCVIEGDPDEGEDPNDLFIDLWPKGFLGGFLGVQGRTVSGAKVLFFWGWGVC